MSSDRSNPPQTEHLTVEQVAAYVDGTLTVEQRAQVEVHLARCAGCRIEVIEVSRLVEKPPSDAPPGPVQLCALQGDGFRGLNNRASPTLLNRCGVVLMSWLCLPSFPSGT